MKLRTPLALLAVAGILGAGAGTAHAWSFADDDRRSARMEKIQEKVKKLKERKQKGREHVELGPRPFWLVDDMDEGPLKTRL